MVISLALLSVSLFSFGKAAVKRLLCIAADALYCSLWRKILEVPISLLNHLHQIFDLSPFSLPKLLQLLSGGKGKGNGEGMKQDFLLLYLRPEEETECKIILEIYGACKVGERECNNIKFQDFWYLVLQMWLCLP